MLPAHRRPDPRSPRAFRQAGAVRARSPRGSAARGLCGALIALLAATFPADARAQEGAQEGAQERAQEEVPVSAGAVWLEFAWPVGLSADVEATQRIVRRRGGADSDVTVRSRYRMTVRDHPRGLAVDHSDGALTGFQSDPPLDSDDPLVATLEDLSDLTSTYIVSDDGMLLDVEGLERGTEALREAFEPLVGEPDRVPGAAAPTERRGAAISADAVKAAVAERWGSMVWFWAWEEFQPDSVYTFTAEVPSPMMPELIVPMEYRIGYLRLVACHEGAAPDSCVHVEARTVPDPASASDFLERFVAELAGSHGEESFQVDAYDQESRFGVTLEPATMIPHEFRMTRSVSVATTENGESDLDTRFDETVLTFHYG
ncbi:MAG TPA: hypothetical protein VML95_10890, partial [Longimicrobiales bacterium]|nr:hypothetical protein [Longimicrobiales bacterium]